VPWPPEGTRASSKLQLGQALGREAEGVPVKKAKAKGSRLNDTSFGVHFILKKT
jgi:hypothetical protein